MARKMVEVPMLPAEEELCRRWVESLAKALKKKDWIEITRVAADARNEGPLTFELFSTFSALPLDKYPEPLSDKEVQFWLSTLRDNMESSMGMAPRPPMLSLR